jgi:predicted RNA-binding protein with PUA-like domain
VGLAEVLSSARADQNEAKSAVIDLKYVSHITPPTTLTEVKQSKLFDDWALVRQSRLSTMAAPDRFVDWMRERYPDLRL